MKTLLRSALNKSMKKFLSFPISFISTPAGFGKTTNVRTFLNNQDVHSVWFSMNGELDEEWAFKKITQLLRDELPYLTEYTSYIPTSRKDIDDFITELNRQLDKHLFIVFDDITIASIPTFMKMIRTYSFNSTPLIHFILMTRESIQSEVFSMSTNSFFIMNSNDFTLSKSEIIQLCKNEDLSLSDDEINYVYNYTGGWATATQLVLKSYEKYNSFYKVGSIDSLIKEVFYNSLSHEVQLGLTKLSILKDFTSQQAFELCESKETVEAIIDLENENYFIQSIDFENYCIVPILKEFLKKELLLSTIDKKELYSRSGLWYLNHNNPLAALRMYLDCKNYDAIIDILKQYNDISFTDISPQLMTEIFENLPNQYKQTHPFVYLKWMLDCITNLPSLNGEYMLEEFKLKLDTNQIVGDKKKLLGEYYFIHAFTYYNDVKKMLEDFIHAYECFDGGYSQFAYPFMIATFGSCHVLYLYYNKVGELQNIVDEIQKNSHYFVHISKGANAGSNEQVIAELAYETGQYTSVLSQTIVAYEKALSRNQISVAISSLFLQGRLALIQFNQEKYDTVIKELKDFYSQAKSPITHCEIDCALSYLYTLNDQQDLVPEWLKEGQLDYSSILHEASLIAPIVHGLYLIKSKDYEKLDMIADIIENANLDKVHVFGMIYAKLYKIVSSYERNFSASALHYFKELMRLCESDHIISPIVELSFAFEGLLDLYIPKNNFESLVIQSSKDYLLKYSETHTNKHASSLLTNKELTVLAMVANNKMLKDIAEELQISTNTVQTHMKSIYRKLNVNTKIEAIRMFEKMNNN